jgi:hypothetical protein
VGSPSPNFDGFREAQKRLRQQFGQDVTWISYTDGAYPPGTQINPETGEPYDPTIERINGSGEVRTIVKASVVSRQISGSGKDQVTKKALGWLEEGGVVFIVDTDDYHLVRDATEVEYAGDRYTIRDDAHDFLGPVDRWLFWGTM